MDRILVIDSDVHFCRQLQAMLPDFGFRVEAAASLNEAAEIGREHSFQMIVTAAESASRDALPVVRWAEREQPAATVVVVMSPRGGHRQAAVLSAGDGAARRAEAAGSSFQSKLIAALRCRRAINEQARLREQMDPARLDGILNPADPQGRLVARQLREAAESTSPVLLTGERGSMCDLMALMIHRQSSVKDGPFLAAPVRPGVPLFGAEKPEFRMGLIEMAHAGTLVVGGVCHLPRNERERIVRFLQTGTFVRSGGRRKMHARVRMILACCDGAEKFLQSFVEHRIELPPLRFRRADIAPLAEEFLAAAAARCGREKPELDAGAAEALSQYEWPGNLEELKAVMDRAVLVCGDRITPGDLNFDLSACANTSWRDIERKAIEEALRANRGNRTNTARQLGMSLRKLQYRLNEYGICRRRR